MKKFGSIIFWCMAFLTIMLAFYVQNNTMIHGDVSYLMNVTNIILSGGKYGIDVFETNPPMILYLYTPPLLLARMTGLPPEFSLHLYVFMLALLSLGACSYLLAKLIRHQVSYYATIAAIIFSFFYLSGYQFGQREHLFIILFMPYVIAAACRLSNYCHPELHVRSPSITIKTTTLTLLVIGISAGLSLGMKPFFLFPLVLIECYFIYVRKNLFGWVRTETIAILFILVLYMLTTYHFHPTYFSILLPLVNRFYFIGVEQPWGYMLTLPNVLYCIAAIVISYFVKKHSHFPMIANVLWLAALGAFLAVFLTRTAWFYHMIPALAFAVILLAFIISDLLSPDTLSSVAIFLLSAFIIFLFPLYVAFLVNSKTAQAEGLAGKEKLIAYFSSQPGPHTLTCFSSNTTGDCFPLVDRSNSTHGSRYPFFWWMRGVLKVSDQPLSRDNKSAIDTLVSVVVDDLNNNQTRWVVINNSDMKIVHGDDFDYIKYFSAYPSFTKAWSSYHLAKTIDYFDIYERNLR